jgi:hypothetical protein
MKLFAAAAAAAALLASFAVGAQWAQFPDRAVPRSADGKLNLAAPAPKAADGKPDLSGVWQTDGEPLPPDVKSVERDLQFPRHGINVAADLPEGEAPAQPWAAELFQQRLQGGVEAPAAYCKPQGIPAYNAGPLPFKIVQTPRLVLVLFEGDTVFRQIFLDGRKPVEDPVPRWMGYSTGKWEGDALVVDSTGFYDRGWLDALGHTNSDALHVVERFRRPTAGRLEVEVTIDDPRAYTKPFTYTVKSTVMADDDLLEYFCAENEKDSQHYK